jgi:hypothetical protein
MLEYSRVVITYSDVYGKTLPLSEAVARLKLFPLDPLLQLLSRADCTLAFLDVNKEDTAQKILIQELLTPEQRKDLKTALLRISRDPSRRTKHLVFHELQILNAIKLALLHCEDSVSEVPKDLTAIGEALLILNDHLAPAEFRSQSLRAVPKEKQEELMRSHLIQTMTFHQGVRIAAFMSRWHDLIFLDAELCKGRPGYRNLLSDLSNITGLDGMLFYYLGHLLLAHWLRITDENAGAENPVLSVPDWFTAKFNLPLEELEPTFDQFCISREAIRTEFERRREWEAYFFLPMQARPILRSGNLAFCLSKRFLAEKLGPGMYHTVLGGQPNRTQGDLFLTYFGYVFESYVHRLFLRIFPPSTALVQRYLWDVRHPETNQQIADGIIVYEGSLVLIETKATLFPIAVLASGDPIAINDKLEAIIFHSARQLNTLIGFIRAGKLAHLGLEPRTIKRFFPLVVSLQFVPLEHLLYNYIMETISKQGCFRNRTDPTKGDPQVAPLQIASVADLERLETALADGMSLVEILSKKTSNESLSCETFGNFLFSQMPQLISHHNPYLQERFKVLTSEVINFAQTRERITPAT